MRREHVVLPRGDRERVDGEVLPAQEARFVGERGRCTFLTALHEWPRDERREDDDDRERCAELPAPLLAVECGRDDAVGEGDHRREWQAERVGEDGGHAHAEQGGEPAPFATFEPLRSERCEDRSEDERQEDLVLRDAVGERGPEPAHGRRVRPVDAGERRQPDEDLQCDDERSRGGAGPERAGERIRREQRERQERRGKPAPEHLERARVERDQRRDRCLEREEAATEHAPVQLFGVVGVRDVRKAALVGHPVDVGAVVPEVARQHGGFDPSSVGERDADCGDDDEGVGGEFRGRARCESAEGIVHRSPQPRVRPPAERHHGFDRHERSRGVVERPSQTQRGGGPPDDDAATERGTPGDELGDGVAATVEPEQADDQQPGRSDHQAGYERGREDAPLQRGGDADHRDACDDGGGAGVRCCVRRHAGAPPAQAEASNTTGNDP